MQQVVNKTLSNYSDMAFQSAFVVLLVALIVSLFYTARMVVIVSARREIAANSRAKELVTVGGPAEQSTAAPRFDTDELNAREAKADKLGGATQALVWLGTVLDGAAVILRGMATGRMPLGNMYEYVMMISFGVFLISSFVFSRRSWRTVWPWVLTPMLALMFYGATKLYAKSAPVVPALQSYWLPIHVTTVSVGASIGIVSGVASLLYLLRTWQKPGKEHGVFGAMAKSLPTADKLDALAYKAGIITLPVFGLGIILGAIWAETAWGRPWGWDPKETVSFVSWILYAAYLHARATPSWRKGAAWINIVALGTMIFNLFFINMVVSGLHSYAGLN
mgnify:CR=1 FL=1